MRSVLSVLGVAALIGGAAPAYAEPDVGDDGGNADAIFLAGLRSAGLAFAGNDQAIVAGHAVCSMANNGETGLQVVKQLTADNPGLTMDGAAQFAAVAAHAYCPHHLQK
ncbi:DUF732 domain-containing protein [Mycolicibacter sp. MYC123]|uniref:DUF732 domain-containing protein n=1 Tax=[Mycobacterium] zoologicum TaxID=2872311 RepID=A0ABU5YIP5_9MYCO|nr:MULTISPECIES: DUF732 domain-containing protein [unclassified Mycolicibacter]MEB3049922.1 DUF732 domain-containing protein [Mycolicibacter sp. MYC123]MEB3063216.1 DUF732 domain-containing protein [Mycolicibacter sp. MYC101]